MKRSKALLLFAAAVAATPLFAVEPQRFIDEAQSVPAPPWPRGDERGMANAIGPRGK